MESTLKLLYLDIKNSTGDLAVNKRKGESRMTTKSISWAKVKYYVSDQNLARKNGKFLCEKDTS